MSLVKDQVIQFIENLNIKHVYGVSGANIEDLFSGFQNSKKTKPVLAKTEYQAALMAMGSYLVDQKPHLVLTTSGAGVLNTLPILAESFTSRIPFVLIAGLVPVAVQGKGGFQDTSNQNGTLDLEAMIKPTVGFIRQVSKASEVITFLQQAFATAEATKKPSVLLIPKNIFSEVTEVILTEVAKPHLEVTDLTEIKQQLKYLKKSPLVILGEEVIHLKNREKINQLIEKLNARVAVTPAAKGFFNHKDTRFLGLTGMMGHSPVADFIEQTETVIVLGSRLDVLSRAGLENQLAKKTLINFSYFNESNYLPVQYNAIGDLDLVIEELLNDI
jgi:acetolactate synthase-1/2/3 large subunit